MNYLLAFPLLTLGVLGLSILAGRIVARRRERAYLRFAK